MSGPRPAGGGGGADTKSGDGVSVKAHQHANHVQEVEAGGCPRAPGWGPPLGRYPGNPVRVLVEAAVVNPVCVLVKAAVVAGLFRGAANLSLSVWRHCVSLRRMKEAASVRPE